MEIGNKDTQYHVRKTKHAIITQRYKCLLHSKLGNQPYPDDINVYYILSLVISHTQMILILLHTKFGNQPYPDDINVYCILSLVISHTQMILMFITY
jgi:hypothetical protein